VADPQDIVDIDELRRQYPDLNRDSTTGKGPARRFLAVWFRCCHMYGRLYRNAAGTRYEGRCPRCGVRVGARIGPDGTSQRTFEAR